MTLENSDKNDDDKNKVFIISFFNKCNIVCDNIENLDGIIIYRDTLINSILYDKIKSDIPIFKTILNSSIFTSVQKNAENNQRWPLINLIRQILKRYNYELKPKRLADGYTKDGQKKYKRLFEIKKKCDNTHNTDNTDNNNLKVIQI
jgi:hypothetical protein